ncbi:alpha/beta fold hydrolase [Geoalkalibacter halelectricus]|uniref:Alpha/beta hydrolase n=1 Tax=Geoalkalibacter halelectricus TaxID=2847045 RepID=A0ABY5ZMX1_9BACT|nr:alpha/beta hydrolase [Geoalkalibacter halelectricus]MDO3379801.1 alpha/beta hydrolase [Geoalkalibacter halelectricus]UWZ79235.1 alpha/beta hydrolase [Geoalkalibacter halelectricus]
MFLYLWGFLLVLSAPSAFAGARSTSQQDPKQASVEGGILVREPIGGSHIFITQAGIGHPQSVVLIHGLGDLASDTWTELIPQLARTYHVVAFDLPGFGRSEKKNLLYSPTYYAEVTKWVVDTFVPNSYSMLGHSMGAAIAMRYASKYPENLEKLILANTAGILHRTVITKTLLQPNISQNAPDLPKHVSQRADLLIGNVIDALNRIPLDIDTLLRNDFLRTTFIGRDPARVAALALVAEDFSPEVFGIQTPTLILWGDRDAVAPLRTAHILRSNLPYSDLQIISETGHVPMLENPQIFNDAVIAYLAESSPKRIRNTSPGSDVGRCNGQENLLFEGSYHSIEIKNCTDVLISNTVSGPISITNSSVNIENSKIIADNIGIIIQDSIITSSGIEIESNIGLEIRRSKCDIAGAFLNTKAKAVDIDDFSSIVFSVSRIRTDQYDRYMHGP